MPTIDIRKITAGRSPTWSGYLRDWDRTLRAANHPETTRYLPAGAHWQADAPVDHQQQLLKQRAEPGGASAPGSASPSLNGRPRLSTPRRWPEILTTVCCRAGPRCRRTY
jgi:hypothetical protein